MVTFDPIASKIEFEIELKLEEIETLKASLQRAERDVEKLKAQLICKHTFELVVKSEALPYTTYKCTNCGARHFT